MQTLAADSPKPTRLQAIGLVLVSVAGRITLALLAAIVAMYVFIPFGA